MAYAHAPAAQPVAATADWPHTSRTLPWLVVALIAMLFLVPIDSTTLAVPMPGDARPDRILLVGCFVIWALVVAVAPERGRAGHRYGVVDFMLLLLALVAVTSVVVNIGPLDHEAELDLATGKLLLLASYLAFYVFIVETVRPREVPALIRLIVALGAVVGVGTLIEAAFNFNPFFWAAAAFSPPGTRVSPDALLLTPGGRADVTGPARHGLADSAMLAMVLPLAVGGSVFARARRDRLLFRLAALLIFAGAVATLRRSGVILPFIGSAFVLALGGRRMIPTAAVFAALILAMPVVAPDAISEVTSLFSTSNLSTQQSISGRTEDYAAIGPDVRTGALIGRGFGSYEAQRYRILDNQYLTAVIETGFLGLLAYLGVIVAAVATALVAGVRRRADEGWIALAGAGSALTFLFANAFFDAFAFPHAPYTFLLVAALVAVSRRGPPGVPARV